MPSNEDVLKSLSHVDPEQAEPVPSTPVIDRTNSMCVVVWGDDSNSYLWFLGYIKEQSDDMFVVDHLACKLKNSKWKYSSKGDVQQVEKDQIVVDCTIEGEWDMEADFRKRLFDLNNSKTIEFAYKKHILELV